MNSVHIIATLPSDSSNAIYTIVAFIIPLAVTLTSMPVKQSNKRC
jgi:hypothetical protein